jgi:hypothetical protein
MSSEGADEHHQHVLHLTAMQPGAAASALGQKVVDVQEFALYGLCVACVCAGGQWA